LLRCFAQATTLTCVATSSSARLLGQQHGAAGITGGIYLYGHSQGTLTVGGLVSLGYISGQGTYLDLDGPALSSASAFATRALYGADFNYNQKFGDIIGLANFPNIMNPLLHPAALIDIFYLAGIHTSYRP
jgi:hypothetical protein